MSRVELDRLLRNLLAHYGSSSSGFPLVVVVSEGKKEDELKNLLPVDAITALGNILAQINWVFIYLWCS